jgi:Calcineurin-like phosphoesterase
MSRLEFMHPSHNRVLTAIALLAGLALAPVTWAQDEWRFTGVERVVAVSDIHGAYTAFERILERANLIDSAGAWIGDRTHLVVVGDVLDRGPDSRQALDLIMRLEREALAAGGRLHFVLGNHEVMNMTGDLRYVAAGEYAAFAAEEPRDLRETAFARFAQALTDADGARAAFDERFPPGFFAHRLAFAPTGHYGAWLLDRPFIVVIDRIAFVHAGLAEAVIAHGTGLNALLRQQLGDYLVAQEALIDAGVLARTDDWYDHTARVEESRAAAGEANWPAELDASAERLIELQTAELFSPDGATWYRGNVACNRPTEQDRLGAALAGLGARALVIGHTPTTEVVLSRMDEMLLRIDTGMLNVYYGGRAAALIIEGGEFRVVYEDEDTMSRPLPQPHRVGIMPSGMTTEDLEAVLARAEIRGGSAIDARGGIVTLADGELELEAWFAPVPSDDNRPAVAAYRLDRLLGLDMVPLTVSREVEGMAGTLQYWPPSAINELERRSEQLGDSAWCPLGDQLNDMYLFDALIFNEARTADRIRYSTDNFQLLLFGHERTFSTGRGRPAYLAEASIRLTQAWRTALSALDEASLTATLGDVLDRRQIRALLERRDQLLAAGR